MWQIMWMLSLLPDWIWHFLIISGLISLAAINFLKHVPFIGSYKLLIKISSILAIVIGIFFEGGIANEAKWQTRVKELEEQVRIAEEKSNKVNVQIKTVVKEKIKVVKDTRVVIQDRIVEKEKIIDAECKVAPEAISILNDAAKLRKGTVTISPIEPAGDNK